MSDTYKLTYFNARAAAEPIRFIFVYAGVPYEDNRVDFLTEWEALKPTIKWGVLPVLEVNGEPIGETTAIARYLAKKFNLGGQSAMEDFRIDELVSAFEIVHKVRIILIEEDPVKREVLKNSYIKNIKPILARGSIIKEENGGKWMVGENLTWADLRLCYDLDCVDTLDPSILIEFPVMKKLQEVVHALPQIKSWLEKRPKTFV